MKLYKSVFILLLVLSFLLLPLKNSYSQDSDDDDFRFNFNMSDGINEFEPLIYFFDLRERETFVQVTNTGSSDSTLHVQIFNVDDNCNENNFFDNYTPNDTHVYNIRDILTNDGNPSGVELPDGAYGLVVILPLEEPFQIIGNMRILDNNGYEYRTNAISGFLFITGDFDRDIQNYSFNFNKKSGVELSDIVGVTIVGGADEVEAADIVNIYQKFDVDIINNNEVPLSCRDVIFSCVDEDNPRLEELLETGEASVASFEYGINEAIPHSKGGEVLCPGNNIDEGHVILRNEPIDTQFGFLEFYGFVGLNNGNKRGSFDSFWNGNFCFDSLLNDFVCLGLDPWW